MSSSNQQLKSQHTAPARTARKKQKFPAKGLKHQTPLIFPYQFKPELLLLHRQLEMSTGQVEIYCKGQFQAVQSNPQGVAPSQWKEHKGDPYSEAYEPE